MASKSVEGPVFLYPQQPESATVTQTTKYDSTFQRQSSNKWIKMRHLSRTTTTTTTTTRWLLPSQVSEESVLGATPSHQSNTAPLFQDLLIVSLILLLCLPLSSFFCILGPPRHTIMCWKRRLSASLSSTWLLSSTR
eukprot:5063804-Amphidinium_carterae.1